MDTEKLSLLKELLTQNSARDTPSYSHGGESDTQGKTTW